MKLLLDKIRFRRWKIFVQASEQTCFPKVIALLWLHLKPLLKNVGKFLMVKNHNPNKLFGLHTTLVLLVLIFQLSGCTSSLNSTSVLKSNHNNSLPNTNDNIAETELNSNRLLWEKSKIDNYDFVCTRFGGGMYPWVPVLIKIRNGRVISREPIRKKLELERTDGYEDFDTVEKIFDQIQNGYDNSFIINVEYNKNLGYPVITSIDTLENSHSFFTIEVSKFEIIKTD